MTRMQWAAVTAAWVVALGALAGAGAPGAADRQYAFAQSLSRTREAPFAVLEFRRFIHQFPQDARVPEARFVIARTYLEVTGDVAAARAELELVVRQHATAPAAGRAQQLVALMAANQEDDYGPVRRFFGAVGARDRGDAAGALRLLDELIARYPRAALAPEALLLRAQVLEGLKRLDDAIAAYAAVPARAPGSPLVPAALLGQAAATEARDGAKPHVLALYRQLVARHPRSLEAAEAQKRLAALERHVDHLPRRFRRADVQPFKLLRQGYLRHRERYELHVEVADRLTEDQVEATLEDALVKHAGDRKDRTHSVRVEAYPPRSSRRVGRVSWVPPNGRPDYEVETTRGDDIWRGILKDVLK